VAAGDRRDASHHHFEQSVPKSARIAAIRYRIGNPSANAEFIMSQHSCAID
jgi:hypothetical protein